jgi:hypothetical protein
MMPYKNAFDVGASVRIRPRDELAQFKADWKYHHALSVEQLAFAGTVTRVRRVGFYHGGDPLYVLEDAPGQWHEVCLELA